jgi:hypothetical protein
MNIASGYLGKCCICGGEFVAGKYDVRCAPCAAIATEARRAGTVKQGPVHEGAGLKGIAQNQSAHKRLGDG